MAFLSGQTVQAGAYAAIAKQEELDAEQLGKLEGQRLQQLTTMGQLQVAQHKEKE
jgi:hypothetical protein